MDPTPRVDLPPLESVTPSNPKKGAFSHHHLYGNLDLNLSLDDPFHRNFNPNLSLDNFFHHDRYFHTLLDNLVDFRLHDTNAVNWTLDHYRPRRDTPGS